HWLAMADLAVGEPAEDHRLGRNLPAAFTDMRFIVESDADDLRGVRDRRQEADIRQRQVCGPLRLLRQRARGPERMAQAGRPVAKIDPPVALCDAPACNAVRTAKAHQFHGPPQSPAYRYVEGRAGASGRFPAIDLWLLLHTDTFHVKHLRPLTGAGALA